MSEAIAAAEQAVANDEVLAGLRQTGSTAPVDYGQLAQFTPNQFWAAPYLVSALYSLAWAYRGAGQPLDAAAVAGRRVLVCQVLATAEPTKYQPEVATTLVDQSTFLQAARRYSEAIAAAEQAVANDEVLAGLRQTGSTAPVDYGQLAQFTPNQFWAAPYLVSALYSLAWAYRGAGQPLDAAAVAGRRVLVCQVLATAEPTKYQPEVATTLVDQSTFLQAARRYSEAIAAAEQAVANDEVLAGLRQTGSTAPVDYGQLAQFTPNQFWAAPYLVSALYSLAWAYRGAGQPLDAAAVAGRRVLVCQVLATAEPTKYQPELTSAGDEERTFWRTAGLPPDPVPPVGPPSQDAPRLTVTGPIAALSRNEHFMDLFAVGPDGGIYNAWWNGTPWHEWFRIGTRNFPAGTPIAALSRTDDFMDLFAVGDDGGLYGNWWNGEDHPWHEWFRIGTRNFPAGTPIAALSRTDDFMDLFAVGDDGGLYGNWWNGEDHPWHEWFRIGTRNFPAGTPIAALSRTDDFMDLFAVGDDGGLYGNWWNGEDHPWHEWFRIGTRNFPAGTPIAALSRTDDFMDLFAVGDDGGLYGNWWNGEDHPWHEWFRIGTRNFPAGTPIAALSRTDDFMDLFAVGDDGGLYGNWWNGEDHPWHEWFRIGTRDFAERISIAALSRNDDHMDLFTTGRDGRVYDAAWNGNPWPDWFPLPTARPRPFYVVGHNPNTIEQARADLQAGANGLEPDVQLYVGNPQLCINHDPGFPHSPSLTSYLDGLHQLAAEFPQLALVVFDCKKPVTSPEHGLDLLTAIRDHLTFDNNLNIIISIASRDENQGAFFDQIIGMLGPREGLMIDAENDPGAVANYFTGRGVRNQGYGNGISVLNFLIMPYYRYTLEAACGDRAGAGRPKFIYVWTVNDHDELREYIRIGVDGAISDDPSDLRAIIAESESATLVRLATRDDNPFEPGNYAYGLTVHTAHKSQAGTDANVTFTLTGTLGTASKTVNTQLVKRMESGDWNYVTIPSDDLGTLKSVTVQRDNHGWAPDWYLDRIIIASDRYGAHAQAIFDRWIDSTSPYTEQL